MAGSNKDWNQTPSPVEDQNRSQQNQLGQTPGPGEQPEQEGSTNRQQEQGAVSDRPQGSSRGAMSGGTTPGRQQSLEGRTDGQGA
jgi:hypothetical protein